VIRVRESLPKFDLARALLSAAVDVQRSPGLGLREAEQETYPAREFSLREANSGY
jgi:hypothetical protein